MIKLSFQKRPTPIPGRYRPVYRISEIILILKLVCRAGKADIIKIHLILWGLQNEENF